MLGEYGEVYVIDWGLARHCDASADPGTPPPQPPEAFGGQTESGAVMGTPGYMSPEQRSAEVVGPPTDVYALGAILFEILSGQKLHLRGEIALDVDPSPSARARDRAIPPELDALCVEALAEEPEHRPTARALADRAQRYLDGDRDLERRRALAAEVLGTARAALDSGDPLRRGDAMKSAGRALALDPESEPAAALVAKLMLEPAPVMPPSLAKRLDDVDFAHASTQAVRSSFSIAAYFLFLPVVMWMGIRDWRIVAGLYGLVILSLVCAWFLARQRSFPAVVSLVVNAAVFVVLSRLTSPFLIVPMLAIAITMLFGIFPRLIDRPVLVIGTNLVAILVPIVLEAAGVWSSTWQIAAGRFIAEPTAIVFDGVAASAFLISVTVASVIVIPLFVRSLAVSQRTGRHQLEVQAWHLEHLIT